MKKIILAVASVMALGLFASCQREISGDLNVTETQIRSGDSTTTSRVFATEGTISYKSTNVTYNKAGNYNSYEQTVDYVFTPTSDVTYFVTKNNNNNQSQIGENWSKITFTGDYVKTTTTITKTSAADTGTKTVKVENANRTSSLKGQTIEVWVEERDGKLYYSNKDGTKTAVAGSMLASSVDFSKFNDSTASTSVSYTGATWDDVNGKAEPTDYTSKYTESTTGYTFTVKLTQK